MPRLQRSPKSANSMPRSRRAGATNPSASGSGAGAAAHVRLNRKICAAAEVDQSKVLEVVSACFAEMSLVNVSTAWHCIARLETENGHSAVETDPRVSMLLRQTKVLLTRYLEAPSEEEGETHPRCVSTIAWACAKLKLFDDGMMASLADLGVRWLLSFKPFELANVLWGFAKLQVSHERFFQMAHDHIQQATQRFNPRSLSMVAWAFATLRYPSCRKLLRKVADAFVAGLASSEEEANPVTIANMVWALATALVHVRPEVLRDIAAATRGRLKDFKAHELSIMLWAFARLGGCDDELFIEARELLCKDQRVREEIHSQGIANLLWAFARHKLEPLNVVGGRGASAGGGDLLTALFPTCSRLLPRLNSVELSSSLWAVAKLSSRFGRHRAADHLLNAGASCMLQEPRLLAGMSMHGVASVLAAYSEFFCETASAPAPCQELLPKLVKYCSGARAAAAAARQGHAVDDLEYFAEAALSGAPTETERASEQPVCRPARGHAAERSAASVPGAVLEALGVPAGAGPSSTASGTNQPPGGINRDCEFAPMASNVPLPRLAALSRSWVSSQQHTPSISFIPEFTSSSDEMMDGKYVDVAFEMLDIEESGIVGVLVETYTKAGKQDSSMFPLDDLADALGMHKLCLPRHNGNWFLCLTMLDAHGGAVGSPSSMSFFDKASSSCGELESQYFNSAASTCAPAGAVPHVSSAASDYSDGGEDTNGYALDSLMDGVANWHLSV